MAKIPQVIIGDFGVVFRASVSLLERDAFLGRRSRGHCEKVPRTRRERTGRAAREPTVRASGMRLNFQLVVLRRFMGALSNDVYCFHVRDAS